LIDGNESRQKRSKNDRQIDSGSKKHQTVEQNVSTSFVENQDIEIICLDSDSDEDDAGSSTFDRQMEKTSKSVGHFVEQTPTIDNIQVQFNKFYYKFIDRFVFSKFLMMAKVRAVKMFLRFDIS
jgi:hypothetical protein